MHHMIVQPEDLPLRTARSGFGHNIDTRVIPVATELWVLVCYSFACMTAQTNGHVPYEG